VWSLFYASWIKEPKMSKTILLIGTLDTKGAEFAYVRELIVARGQQVILLDAGILGDPPFVPEISAAAVAEAGGGALDQLRAQNDRGKAVETMMRGATKLTVELQVAGKIVGGIGRYSHCHCGHA
jgi:uncharacterized protein (UPF0261 family)